MTTNICGVLLAAGYATRFGEQKLLYTLPNGVKIIEAAAKTLKTAIPRCTAVVRNDSDEITKILIDEGYDIVVNPNSQTGMGSSIKCGISSSIADAWVIALADMPYIQIQTIIKIKDLLEQGEKIVVPSYKQQHGHPVGFDLTNKNQLLELNDAFGAKHLLNSNINLVKTFEIDDPGIIQDIDRKQDIIISN